MAAQKTRTTDATTSASATPAAPGDPIEGLFETWILPYGRQIAAAVLLVLVAIAVVRVVSARREERLGAGFAALSKAEDTEALQAVARDHDGSPAAARARLQAARRLYDEGKYDQAATAFSLAHKAAADPALAVAAGLGEAYAVEASGQPEAAEKTFADMAAKTDSKAMAIDAWLGAGRCAKAQGKLAEAEKYLERATAAVGDNQVAQWRVNEVRQALQASRHATRPSTAAAPAAEAAEKPAATPAAQP